MSILTNKKWRTIYNKTTPKCNFCRF